MATYGIIYPGSVLVGVEFLPIFVFLGDRNFGCRYASKPIKDSKDADDNLDSTKLEPKKWLIRLAHRAR